MPLHGVQEACSVQSLHPMQRRAESEKTEMITVDTVTLRQ
jgi:hypothetical protein